MYERFEKFFKMNVDYELALSPDDTNVAVVTNLVYNHLWTQDYRTFNQKGVMR